MQLIWGTSFEHGEHGVNLTYQFWAWWTWSDWRWAHVSSCGISQADSSSSHLGPICIEPKQTTSKIRKWMSLFFNSCWPVRLVPFYPCIPNCWPKLRDKYTEETSDHPPPLMYWKIVTRNPPAPPFQKELNDYRGPGFLSFVYFGSPPSSPGCKLSLFLSLPVCRRSSLLTEEVWEGLWEGAKSYDEEKAWSSINRSILYGSILIPARWELK